uniref:CD9 antigen-like n=1 Tax=Sinocyclocheilus rhinocerous TaxID=307959 RepID=A0A673K7I0_9TELE
MGKVEGGMKCVKYLLFVFNFIFWLMGSLVLAVGLWLRLDPNTVSLLEEGGPDTFFIGVYILIAAGGLVMLVGFFGCCGAVRESQCLLGLFFACLLVIFGAEVAAGVFGFLNKDEIIKEIKQFYDESVRKTEAQMRTIIYAVSRTLVCLALVELYNTSVSVTSVQCALKLNYLGRCGAEMHIINQSIINLFDSMQTCHEAIEEFFSSKLFIVGYVGIGIAGVMVNTIMSLTVVNIVRFYPDPV